MTRDYQSRWEAFFKKTEPYYQSFVRSLEDCNAQQERKLLQILDRSSNTEFGRKLSFKEIKSVEAFQASVPLTSGEDFSPLVQSEAAGKGGRLFYQQPILFEETSGTCSGRKLVGYTRESIEDFRKACLPWLNSLLQAYPSLLEGPWYFAMSFSQRSEARTSGGFSIGADDAFYFGKDLGTIIRDNFVYPKYPFSDFNSWKRSTLKSLIEEENLRLISVWSPSFLLVLIESMREELGFLDLNASRNDAVLRGLRLKNLRHIWPNLALISCWSDGPSKVLAENLKTYLPDVPIQGKGLLATEGAVSVPLPGASAPVLACDSGFYEFVDEAGEVFWGDKLKIGREYKVVMTNHSGLYRYSLGDRIQVKGFLKNTPCFEFVGRENTSDLCGEKLSDVFVGRVLKDVVGGRLAIVYPSQNRYVALVEAEGLEREEYARITDELDGAFSTNPHYSYARSLGQLEKVTVASVLNLRQRLIDFELSRGQRLGDVKQVSLHSTNLEALH